MKHVRVHLVSGSGAHCSYSFRVEHVPEGGDAAVGEWALAAACKYWPSGGWRVEQVEWVDEVQ